LPELASSEFEEEHVGTSEGDRRACTRKRAGQESDIRSFAFCQRVNRSRRLPSGSGISLSLDVYKYRRATFYSQGHKRASPEKLPAVTFRCSASRARPCCASGVQSIVCYARVQRPRSAHNRPRT